LTLTFVSGATFSRIWAADFVQTKGSRPKRRRYHLYVSLTPHRALTLRSLKWFEDMITVSVVHWLMLENGWTFADGPGVVPDTVNHARFLHQIYTAADSHSAA